MSRAVILSAVRTPIGRYGGALAGVRPDDLAAVAVRSGRRARGRRPGPDRRRLPGLREPGGRGQPRRRPHGGAARRLPPVGARRDAEPAVRVGPLGGGLGLPRRHRRRRRPLRRRRGRVDDAGAALDAQARAGVRARAPHGLRHDARLALSQPAARGDVPAREHGGDGRERRRALRRLPGGSGRVRPALAGAVGGGAGRGPLRGRARPGRRSRARRASAAGHERRAAWRRCGPRSARAAASPRATRAA